MPADATDEELLRLIAAGHERAFAAFYGRHLPSIVAYFVRHCGDRELAFDLTAETFAAVVIAAPRYEPRGAPASWLFGIARNKLLESLRHRRVDESARRRLAMEPIGLEDADLCRVEELASAGAGPLEAALQGLPEGTRLALTARVIDGMEYAEIAQALRCSEQVVRQRVHRGLRTLRAQIGKAR